MAGPHAPLRLHGPTPPGRARATHTPSADAAPWPSRPCPLFGSASAAAASTPRARAPGALGPPGAGSVLWVQSSPGLLRRRVRRCQDRLHRARRGRRAALLRLLPWSAPRPPPRPTRRGGRPRHALPAGDVLTFILPRSAFPAPSPPRPRPAPAAPQTLLPAAHIASCSAGVLALAAGDRCSSDA